MAKHVKPENVDDADLDQATGGAEHLALMAAPLVMQKPDNVIRRALRVSDPADHGAKGGNVETTWKVEKGEK